MESDDPHEDAIRQGEPPYGGRSSRAADAQPKDDTDSSLGAWIGGTSLVCACIAWLGACLTFLAETGRLPKEVTHNPVSFLLVAVCALLAIFGGALSALSLRSKTGCLAFFMAALLPLIVMSFVYLVGSGWQD